MICIGLGVLMAQGHALFCCWQGKQKHSPRGVIKRYTQHASPCEQQQTGDFDFPTFRLTSPWRALYSAHITQIPDKHNKQDTGIACLCS